LSASINTENKSLAESAKVESFGEICLWLVLVLVFGIYAFQFFAQGGRANISPDGKQYILLAEGEAVNPPMNTRILQPKLAAWLAALTHLSVADAFRILTPLELFAALLLLKSLLQRRAAKWFWQAAVLLAFGSSTAFFFGHTPVLIDTLVLLFACLLLELLDRKRYFWALLCVCLAVLTKEYCIALGAVLTLRLYRQGHRKEAIGAMAISVLAMLINFRFHSGSAGSGTSNLLGFLQATIAYEAELFRTPNIYKILYIWLWAAMWPLLLLAILSLISQIKSHKHLLNEHWSFALLLLATPLLLTGDWNRSLLLIVPFAGVLATSHALAKDKIFALYLAIGALATTLATPFYAVAPPRLLTVAMMAVSFLASLLLIWQIGRFYFLKGLPLHEAERVNQ
jgi:hypothetical protein